MKLSFFCVFFLLFFSFVCADFSTYLQKLDHFDPTSKQTFKQQFIINTSFQKSKSSPIFLVIGGTNPLGLDPYVFIGESPEVSLASKYGAVLLALEHRFYGSSLPYNTLTTSTLKYLTPQQVLGDIVSFVSYIKQNQELVGPVVVIGYRYAANIAAWVHLKYPFLVQSAIAISPQLQAEEESQFWDQYTPNVLGTDCSANIKNTMAQIEYNVFHDSTDFQNLASMLGCSSISDATSFMNIIAYAVTEITFYTSVQQDLCNTVTNSQTAISQFLGYLNGYFAQTNITCLNRDITSLSNTTFILGKNRQLLWMRCNQFGEFETAYSSSPFRSTRLNVGWFEGVCTKIFGYALTPDVTSFNQFYGGQQANFPGVVFFFNQNEPLSNLGPTNPIPSSPVIVYKNNWFSEYSDNITYYINTFLQPSFGNNTLPPVFPCPAQNKCPQTSTVTEVEMSKSILIGAAVLGLLSSTLGVIISRCFFYWIEWRRREREEGYQHPGIIIEPN